MLETLIRARDKEQSSFEYWYGRALEYEYGTNLYWVAYGNMQKAYGSLTAFKDAITLCEIAFGLNVRVEVCS